jgi:hypothetical protein
VHRCPGTGSRVQGTALIKALIPESFGKAEKVEHTEFAGKTFNHSPEIQDEMKNRLLTISAIVALTCIGQAKDKSAPEDAVQGSAQANAKPSATIIVYRQWSLAGSGVPNWKFNVDNGPDLIIRNGTYVRLDVAPGDHVLDHKHMFLLGSDPQTVHVRAGETIYFQYVEAASLIFEVADNQAQAARTVSTLRTVEEALAHSRH